MEQNSVEQLERAAQVTKLGFIQRPKKLGDEHDGEVRFDFTNMEQERYREAVKDFNKFLKLYTECSFAYAGRGAAYHSRRQHGKAVRDFTRAIRLDSDNVAAAAGLKLAKEQLASEGWLML